MNHTPSPLRHVAPSAWRGLVRPALASTVFFMAVTGIAYPLVTTGVAQAILPGQAQGSLIRRDGMTIGSRLIGQYFTEPGYFHGRPSVTSGSDPANPTQTVDEPYNATSSNASNQGVLNRKLLGSVDARAKAYRQENGLRPGAPVPVDAVTASASGLDPDISLANAQIQVQRVARARGRSTHEVLALLGRHTQERQLGILGEPRINVLELNLGLDAAWPAIRAPH